MDYGSLSNLTHWLAELFRGDPERHPGIDLLRLPPDVATAWKQRIATQPDGRPRGERYGLLTAVRAFYTDLNQWAYEDPPAGRSGPHPARSPKPTWPHDANTKPRSPTPCVHEHACFSELIASSATRSIRWSM
jgi:hypothetical protein